MESGRVPGPPLQILAVREGSLRVRGARGGWVSKVPGSATEPSQSLRGLPWCLSSEQSICPAEDR